MAERRFTRGLGRPGMAAQVRENVSQAVKATATQVRPRLADPIDFEEYINKNKVVLTNDSLRELLLYPNDDISFSVVKRESRTLYSLSAEYLTENIVSSLAKQCLTTYSQDLTKLSFKCHAYSGSYLQLPRIPRADSLKEQVYEIDTDIEQGDLTILTNGEHILKKGYLLKGPENSNDKIFGNFSSKTFKRRFACLRQEVDGTYLLEFYKDERKQDSKGTMVMDFCISIGKNPKRGKCCFELAFSEGTKNILLSAESENDLEDWMDKLTRVIHADKSHEDCKVIEKGIAPPIGTYGTLRGLEHSLNPQLIKYAHETEFSIAQARKEERQQLFSCYPQLLKSVPENGTVEFKDETEIWPYEEKFGTRFRVICESIKFKLQGPLDSAGGPLSQMEPYMLCMALYDIEQGCKISEDFHFDLNSPMIRSLLLRPKKKYDDLGSSSFASLPIALAGVPEEWLAYPKQAVMSVMRPHSEIYLIIFIEKVLQGSINTAVEPYLKPPDPKGIQKLQKTIKTCCSRLGDFRMPFGWCAKPVFKNSKDLDTFTAFSPIFKMEEKRISDSEIIRLLSDLRKVEKVYKWQTIPGSITINISPMEVTTPNSLTPSMEPVKPFPNPPTHEPTVEIQELGPVNKDDIYPYVGYCNHLYVYPLSLNYDNQKTFGRARNITCCVELKECDLEGSEPLKAIYGKPGEGILTFRAFTAVLHHNTSPEWRDEIKVALPHNLASSHHLLFTFYHVSIEGSKAGKKEEPIETVGYAWLPLLSKGRINLENKVISVAAHLPAKYLSIEPLGLGKGFSGPEIRWVDCQKSVFCVSLALCSTVLSSDQHLHNFFMASADLIPKESSVSPDTPIDIGIVKSLKALLALEVETIILFLPTLMNQLLFVLLHGGSDAPSNVTRALVHIVDQLYEIGRVDILHSYIKYVMNISSSRKKTVHEELCHSLTFFLQLTSMDHYMLKKILHHSQIFFSIIVRSMALHLLTTTRIKMTRNERFTDDFETTVRSLVELTTLHIIQKYKECPVEHCLSMMDRGFVFGLIKLYLEHFSPGDPISLQHYKFTFLRIVCSHEHYIPLNLPVFSTSHLDFKKAKIRAASEEFSLSTDFISHHFLVGVLLTETKSALGEIAEIQKTAIRVLRDVLAKHALDDRYLQSSQQGRISCLYFPITSILLENVFRLDYSAAKQSSDAVSLRKVDQRSSTRSRISRSGGGSVDYSNLSVSTPVHSMVRRTDTPQLSSKHDSSYLAIIADPGGLTSPGWSPAPYLLHGRSSLSIESGDHPPSTICTDMFEEDASVGDSVSRTHSRNLSVAFAGENGPVRYDKLSHSEGKDLILCFLHVLKHVPEIHLVAWWNTLSLEQLIHFFALLQLALHFFCYIGKRQIVKDKGHKKSSTLPVKLQPPSSNLKSFPVIETFTDGHDNEAWQKALQEANLCAEVGMVVLGTLGAFTSHCKALLTAEGSEKLMQCVFSLHMLFMQLGQSESVMKHVFASLRSFLNNFPKSLFESDATLCGSLCFELLKCCNSKLSNVRHEACAALYLLMRSNYEYTQRSGINRVHLQVIISVSQLLGEEIGLNNSRFQESMALINSYASSDKAMKNTGFVTEVRDLTKRIRTVLVATAQMREHEKDPEMLCDLQYSLANSYAATPELRTTWLQAMSKHHIKNGDLSEAAFCYLHVAALIAEYLKYKNEYSEGCEIFSIISPNISKDESNLRLDSDVALSSQTLQFYTGIVDTVFTLDSLIDQLEMSVAMIERAERYELLGNLYRILVPIYEKQRNYKALVQCYGHLHQAYSRVVDVNSTQKRLLGRYYRVAFYGTGFFEDEAGREYVYKEPKVTSLAEISERLYHQYCEKFGKEIVKMIMDSNFVTHVNPYFNEEERLNRQTEFEYNNNVDKFMFETPFTLEGKSHGKLEDQWKRRVILTTDYLFPYVKKRIMVLNTEIREMSPIEVAIDEMEGRVKELKEIIDKSPTDVKKLQLKLQGSISVQVNAGPLAYANAFLEEMNSACYPVNQVARLKDIYKEFMHTCKQALDLNRLLISSDQYEYQMVLETNFSELLFSLSSIMNEPMLPAQIQCDSLLKRSSQHYLNMISSPGGTSSV